MHTIHVRVLLFNIFEHYTPFALTYLFRLLIKPLRNMRINYSPESRYIFHAIIMKYLTEWINDRFENPPRKWDILRISRAGTYRWKVCFHQSHRMCVYSVFRNIVGSYYRKHVALVIFWGGSARTDKPKDFGRRLKFSIRKILLLSPIILPIASRIMSLLYMYLIVTYSRILLHWKKLNSEKLSRKSVDGISFPSISTSVKVKQDFYDVRCVTIRRDN